MFAQVLKTFWTEKNLVKSRLISTLDKVIYYVGTFLQGSTKLLFTTQNKLFTNMLLLAYVDPTISMVVAATRLGESSFIFPRAKIVFLSGKHRAHP
jgi:hypothetical protein